MRFELWCVSVDGENDERKIDAETPWGAFQKYLDYLKGQNVMPKHISCYLENEE